MDFTYTKNVLLRLLTELLSDYTAEEIKEEIEFELEKIKMLEKKVIPVELPVRREIYDRLLYYCWCVRFEKDEDFMLTKTHDAYKEFLTQTETHDGDCTLQAVSCMRCHLQACEIEAQKLYNYLCGK